MKPSDILLAGVAVLMYGLITGLFVNAVVYEARAGRLGSAATGTILWLSTTAIIAAGVLVSMGR